MRKALALFLIFGFLSAAQADLMDGPPASPFTFKVPITDQHAGVFIPLIAGTVNGVSCSATTPFTCMQFCAFKGNQIIVNGGYVTIPGPDGCVGAVAGFTTALTKTCIENASFVTTCNTSLANGTTYFAFLGYVSGVINIIFSTNSYDQFPGSAAPVAIMTGDPSRSLIGLIRTDAGAAAVSGSGSQQNSASFYNSIYDGLTVTGVGPFSNNAAYTALGQVTFVQFSNNVPTFAASCVFAQNSGSTTTPTLGIGVSTSGTAATVPSASSQVSLITGNALGLFVVNQSGAIGSDGFVIGNILALESANTSTGVASCTLQVPSRVPS